ncbi:hypothetical protein DRP05_02745 [Archaeoglobales archaeon]|nr:MAG: hypothetical protein DRO97_10310 [Archaeoglobales archaeon]RLI79773.1 MAG: hypothetical protein DRP05_02745 [Archaeoglobales archaeon]
MDEIVSRDELQILLNMEDEVSVMFPFYHKFELLKAKSDEDGYRIKVLVGRQEFDVKSSRLGDYSNEMPNYNDFLECLLSSGVMKYKNEAKFMKKIKHYRGMSKKVYFCPDTNVIYHRFISNSSIFRQNEIVLVDAVKGEIEANLNFKFSPHQIHELKNLVRYQSFLLDEWVNKRMKRSRRAAYIALRELKRVKDAAISIEGAGSSDKEENDRIIVKSIKRFEREKNALPVLLTADVSMTDLCEIEGVEYFLFEIPHAIKADYCKAEQMLELVYNLAVVFGVIKLNSTLIFGEFRGKSRYEELKLKFLDDRIAKEFRRDLKICRKLMELKIER